MLLPICWVVERTFAWMGRYRINSKEEAARWPAEARQALPRDGYCGPCGCAASSASWVPDRAGLEGACEQMVGRRMKQTGARWDVRDANRVALLCSLAHADSLTLCLNAA